MARELLIISTLHGLAEALGSYEDISPLWVQKLPRALSMITGTTPPDLVYVDDSTGTADDLMKVVEAAQQRHIPIALGIRGPAMPRVVDFRDAGLAVSHDRDTSVLATWIAAQFAARQRASKTGQNLIVFGSAKGGVGKTTAMRLFAEGLHCRGLNVLIVEGDISNSGIATEFRIPSGAPTYLHIPQDGGGWTPENLRRYIYHHQPSNIDFLLASDDNGGTPLDLSITDFGYFIGAVQAMSGYDVVILDTGPEIVRRPYAAAAAYWNQAHVIIPTPPDSKARSGAGNLLQQLERKFPNADLTSRALLLMMEPERGVGVTIPAVQQAFAQRFPNVRVLGTLPRDPRLLSIVGESEDHYVRVMDVGPYTRLVQTTQDLVDTLCSIVGLTPLLPKPRVSPWQRLFQRNKLTLPTPTARSMNSHASETVGVR